MAKKAIFFALGGHISTQNASFRKLAEILEDKGFQIYGAENGFEAFETRRVYELKSSEIPRCFAGFVAGADRYSLKKKDRTVDTRKLEMAIDFFRKGKFNVAVGSGGDDHGQQMAILHRNLRGITDVYTENKTVDNDLGGKDGEVEDDGAVAPFTDFTNGYHTGISVGVDLMKTHFAGAWTNNVPYLIGVFGRDANWIGISLAYWGFADRIIYGELPDDNKGHNIEKIHELILESQDRNEKLYGRRFAMVVVPESTRINGIKHVSEDLIDAHGHHKLEPGVLVSHLKKELELWFGMKTQNPIITYEMRNSPPTGKDLGLAECSAETLANSILRGESGVESVFKIVNGGIQTGVAPIDRVSRKRLASYYPKPLINYETLEVTDEIGRYYKPLFGGRGRLEDLLPSKPVVVNVPN